MSLIAWSDQFKVGVGVIDTQHRELFRMANELAEAMKKGRGKEVLSTLFSDLTAYTVSHFSMEERLMAQHAYSGAAEHKRQHDELKKRVAEMASKASRGGVTVSIETLNMLRDWLSHHIHHTDTDLARHLNAAGVR